MRGISGNTQLQSRLQTVTTEEISALCKSICEDVDMISKGYAY